ncbi:hypothetical protein ACET3X_009095 [Alternaria dauci]|uniref:Mating type protein 1-2-1 n=1 Tax=Alternaria dauci TaxID=48095 RepID=A0ABR3U7U9_9PLEO
MAARMRTARYDESGVQQLSSGSRRSSPAILSTVVWFGKPPRPVFFATHPNGARAKTKHAAPRTSLFAVRCSLFVVHFASRLQFLL